MTFQPTRNAISSQVVASGPLQLDLLAGLTIENSGPAPVPASRSRPPAKGSEPMTQGICGRTFFASSVPDGPLSSWESRLRERLATVGSTESALIWREKTTPAGRSISRLAVSTRHTNGTGSTGSLPMDVWPTATALDRPRTDETLEKSAAFRKRNAGQNTTPLYLGEAMIRLSDTYPVPKQASPRVTPSARDWKDSAGMATESGDRNRVDQLPRQMAQNVAYMPTPLESHHRLGMPERWKGSQSMNGRRSNLNDAMAALAYLPTPTASKGGSNTNSAAVKDRGHGNNLQGVLVEMAPTGPTLNGSTATTAKRGAPNPVFAFWLMGFPDEWISGALEAMRSYRRPRRK